MPEPRHTVRSRQGLHRRVLGLAGALAFHGLFLGLIVFRLSAAAPVRPEPAQGFAAVSVSMVRDASRLDKPQADDVSPAAALQAKAPLPDAPTAPAAAEAVIKPAPRPDPAALAQAPIPLSPQRPLLAVQDLTSEPMPLHSQVGPTPSRGSSPPAAGAPDCHLASTIQQVLQQNPAVVAAIARLPRQSRSVANAVMLWQGVWPSIDASDQPMAVIQSSLQATIRQTNPTCRDQPMRGPQFIPVSQGSDTTVLVVGSGEWTWAQLLR